MKILITGGSGFIGKNLSEYFEGKLDCIAPSSSELDLLQENSVYSYLKENRFDAVVHTATWNATRNSDKDPSMILENNLKMFFNLARCGDHYGKMLYYGSGAEYDRENWIPKMKEEYFDSHVPRDSYGFSKYIMRKYVGFSENIYNLCLFGIFGKYEDWEIRFISNACCKAVYGLPISIKQNVVFDYMHIDDLAGITGWFIKNTLKEKVFNICSGVTYDLYSLAQKVIEMSGKKLDIIVKEPGIQREYSGDNSRLLGLVGGYNFKPMDSSIKDLYNWYLSNKNKIDREKLLSDK